MMAVCTEHLELSTKGDADIVDITARVSEKVRSSRMKNGIANVSCVGSTGALTTCEYEPGLVEDLKDLFRRLIPEGSYHHDQAWGDGNGHAHLRASLVGPSVTIPFVDGELSLGTWQQIIFVDFDNRPRRRKLVVQVMGE